MLGTAREATASVSGIGTDRAIPSDLIANGTPARTNSRPLIRCFARARVWPKGGLRALESSEGALGTGTRPFANGSRPRLHLRSRLPSPPRSRGLPAPASGRSGLDHAPDGIDMSIHMTVQHPITHRLAARNTSR